MDRNSSIERGGAPEGPRGVRGESNNGLLTDHVQQREDLAQVVPVRPPIVKAQVLPEVVEQHLLLLLLLHLGAQPDVEIHHEGMNLATLPALP